MAKTREQTKAETREALIDAGMALFAEQGLDQPSLDAICARAGFTRGAFYVHFADREDFQVAVMEKVISLFLDTIVQTTDEARDLERSVNTFVDVFSLMVANAPGPGEPVDPTSLPAIAVARGHLIVEACQRSPLIRERYVALISEGMARVGRAAAAGQEAGTVRTDVEAETAGQLLVTLVLGLLSVGQTGVPIDVEAVRKAVLTLIQP